MTGLEERYAGTEPTLLDWEKEDLCTAQLEDERWYRSRILSLDEEQHTARVYAIDFGYEVQAHHVLVFPDKNSVLSQ